MSEQQATQAFQSIVQSPFSGVAVGDAAALQREGINFTTGQRSFSADSKAYLAGLDVAKIAQTYGRDFGGGSKFGGLFGAENVAPHQLEMVCHGLARILPDSPALRGVVQDLAAMLGEVAQAYGGVSLNFGLVANLQGNEACFHHDNFTEHRWLVTLPTEGAQGTLMLDNEWQKQGGRLPGALPQSGQHHGEAANNYGLTTAAAAFAQVIRQAPIGVTVGWHGEETGNPLIHSEPLVKSNDEARLTLIITPTAMAEREVARRRIAHNRPAI
jgi:hypothetical protein